MKIVFFDVWWTLMDTTNDLFIMISSNEEIQKKFKKQFFLEKSLLNDNKFKTVKELLNLCEKKLKINNSISMETLYFEIYLNNIYLYDWVLEVLNKLQNKWYKLIIVSDADSDILIPQLKILWIYNYFSEIIVSSDVKWYKPSDNILNEIKKYVSIGDELYFIWDSIVDIQTWKKIWAKSILINLNNELKNYSQDYTISHIKELLKILW